MRRLALALLASTALLGTASAADLAPARVAAPPVVAAYNWTGWYVGGFLGGAWTNNDADIFHNNWLVHGFKNDRSSFIGGLQLGYNWQNGPYVFGLQGDIGWLSAKHTDHFYDSYDHWDHWIKSEASWLASLTGRLGYAWDRSLLYVKGGGAWTNLGARHTFYDGSSTWANGRDGNRSGWTLGVGWEYAWAPNWTGFIEYDYYNFGNDTASIAWRTDRVDSRVDANINVVKVGINYKFGGSPYVAAPVSARY